MFVLIVNWCFEVPRPGDSKGIVSGVKLPPVTTSLTS